jgi:hypothetical protein
MSKKIVSLLKQVLISIAFCGSLYGDKVCPGSTCPVPDDCDCKFHREVIVTTPLIGADIPHLGVLIRVFSAGNQYRKNQTLRGSLSHNVEINKQLGFDVTGGGEVSGQVTVATGIPVLVRGEATIGVKTHLSGKISKTWTDKTIDVATWQFEVSSCQRHSSNLLGDWVEGKWSSVGFRQGIYYTDNSDGSTGPIKTVECSRVSSAVVATAKYQHFYIEANRDQRISLCY